MRAKSLESIRRALETAEIVPHFQPIVDLRLGCISGFEILARWNHPTLGLVHPSDFVPCAERGGLSGLLTTRMLSAAFSIARASQEEIFFSVNISPTQLMDRQLAEQIEQVAQATAFPLKCLTIEITENALMKDVDRARAVAEDLKSIGCKLSLDDFGTGYSSLAHLQALPFDELKVDQSFVRSMTVHRDSRKIVAAVIGLGRSLGLTTVAEGVEDRSQAEMLLCLGCDLAQGWLYGKPLAADGVNLAERHTAVPPRNQEPLLIPNSSVCLEALPGQRYAQLRAIYDGAPVGLSFLDCDLRYVSLNRRLTEIIGGSVQEHLGRKVHEVIPELFEQAESYLRRALQGEPILGVELIKKDNDAPGGFLTLLASYQPARDEADEVIGVSVSIVDISERKRAEEALRQGEARLQAVIDAVPVGVAIAEAPSGRIVSRNPAARRILEQDPMAFEKIDDYSEHVAYFHEGKRLEAHEFPMARALHDGITSKINHVFYAGGQHEGVWLNLAGAPIRNESAEIVAAVVVIQETSPPVSGWNSHEIPHTVADPQVGGQPRTG